MERPALFATDRDFFDFFNSHLRWAWERYLTLVHLAVSLAGATLLVYLNGLFAVAHDRSWAQIRLIILAMILAALSLIAAVVWRASVQFFMERELGGQAENAKRHFVLFGVTDASVTAGVGSDFWTALSRFGYYSTKYVSIALLLFSWFFGALFVVANIG